MGGAPSIPQINPNQVFAAIRQNIAPIAQKQFDVANRFGGQAAQRDIERSQQFAPQYAQLGLDLTKQFAPQYAQAGFDIANQFAPQYLNLNLGQMQSAIAGSPLLSQMNTQAQSGLTDAYGNLARGGVDPLLGDLTTQAQQQLGQQGHLSQEEAYQQTQGTLGTFAGRNNVFNQAEAQSFLDRDKLVRQRMQEAQAFAGNVEGQRQGALGLAQSRLGQAQQFGIGTQGMNLGTLSGLGGAVQAPNYAGYAQEPNLAAYAAPGQSLTPLTSTLGATSGILGTVAPIAADIFSSNQNAAANQAISGANKSSGIAGGALSAVGSIAAAY